MEVYRSVLGKTDYSPRQFVANSVNNPDFDTFVNSTRFGRISVAMAESPNLA
jgi:hypothetical protein